MSATSCLEPKSLVLFTILSTVALVPLPVCD